MNQESFVDRDDLFEQEKKDFSERYCLAKDACRNTLVRLKNDLKETHGNPYIRATSIVRYEILNTADDEVPVDVFEFRKTNGCYLRTLALAAGIVATAELLILRAKFKKKKAKARKK